MTTTNPITPTPTQTQTRTRRRGFSLLEAMLAITVLAVIAAVVSPVVSSSSDVYLTSMTFRGKSERVGFAVERCVRLFREIPVAASGTAVAITTANPDQILLNDHSGIQLDGTDLVMVDTAGNKSALCRHVTQFSLTYVGTDGVTNTAATPGLTRRINITIAADGFSLTSAASLRAGTSL